MAGPFSDFIYPGEEFSSSLDDLYLPVLALEDCEMGLAGPSSLKTDHEAKPSLFALCPPTPAVGDFDPDIAVPVPPHSPFQDKFPPIAPITRDEDGLDVAQERRDRDKEIFTLWAESRFSPLDQMRRPARPSPFMNDFDFTYSFWNLVDVPLITLAPESGLPHQVYENFTKEQKKRVRFFSVQSYPSTFWHLVERLIPIHDCMLDFFEANDQNIHLLDDFPRNIARHMMKKIQLDHQKLVTKLDSVMIGEWNGQIAYPDVEVNTMKMFLMFRDLRRAQEWLRQEVDNIHQLATKRAHLLELMETGGNTRGVRAAKRRTTPGVRAEFRIRTEAKVGVMARSICDLARRLRKVHRYFAGEFLRLHNHLADNMSYKPAAGPLFDEEIHPIRMNPIYEGYAMDPAAESVDWMKNLISEEEE
ncbi:uncharacterized protein N7483_011952 [Penicillium malachiteum]|uniref:uncharacterized protein n=1 Tax=Penicillium malachiteum TaxID=1324776 RepID=UPI002546D66E|nr:uncharacterized protein N7483_011952 [Penicillium malachiteum]KAJ5714771.1 hypothetical protein N7483_011952 [Penicillium malachiteum]